MFGDESVEFQVCNILDFDANYSARELEKLRTSQPLPQTLKQYHTPESLKTNLLTLSNKPRSNNK